MESLRDDSEFRNDQINTNLSNACVEEKRNSLKIISREEVGSGKNASGNEKGSSVGSDCGEEKGGSVTKVTGEEKGRTVTVVSREEKGGSGKNTCGEEKEGGTNVCGSCGSKGSFQRCSRCKSAFYCSEECQMKDWPTHKGSCTKVLIS